jgi:hypothetical protein
MEIDKPNDDRGGGGIVDPAKRWEQRQHLRILEQAIYQGWDIPSEAFATIPIDLLAIIQDDNASPRDRIRATEALSHLASQRMDAVVEYDRIKRLDAGLATNRHEILQSLTDAQIAAVGAALIPNDAAKATRPETPRRKRGRSRSA